MSRESTREDVLGFFELLDARPELEPRDESPVAVMTGEAVPEKYQELIDDGPMTEEDVRQSGDQVVYHHEAGKGFYIFGEYSPDATLDDGLVVDGFLSYDDQRLQGEVVEDAYMDIIKATQAPYLDRGLSEQDLERHVAEDSLGTFDVPAGYDQDALEQSVEAAVQRLSAAAAVQDAVEETAAAYADELSEDGYSGYQQ